jgi:hypothetical protein
MTPPPPTLGPNSLLRLYLLHRRGAFSQPYPIAVGDVPIGALASVTGFETAVALDRVVALYPFPSLFEGGPRVSQPIAFAHVLFRRQIPFPPPVAALVPGGAGVGAGGVGAGGVGAGVGAGGCAANYGGGMKGQAQPSQAQPPQVVQPSQAQPPQVVQPSQAQPPQVVQPSQAQPPQVAQPSQQQAGQVAAQQQPTQIGPAPSSSTSTTQYLGAGSLGPKESLYGSAGGSSVQDVPVVTRVL